MTASYIGVDCSTNYPVEWTPIVLRGETTGFYNFRRLKGEYSLFLAIF